MIIANFLTLLNALSGIVSISLSIKGYYVFSAYLILMGMILDYLDGKVARMLNASSSIGKYLDSAADCITFGIAPVVFIGTMMSNSANNLIILLLLTYSLCAMFRLIRYCVHPRTGTTEVFNGLPVPAAAGCLVSFILIFLQQNLSVPIVPLTILIVCCSVLMLSNIQYYHFSRIIRNRSPSQLVIIILLCLSIFIFGNVYIVLFLFFFMYLIFNFRLTPG